MPVPNDKVTEDIAQLERDQKDAVAGAPASDAASVVDTWFQDHFVGSHLAATTELYNAAYAAKEDLKKRLAQ